MKKSPFRRTLAAFMFASLCTAVIVGAQKSDPAAALLQSAIHKQIVDGDLKEAIKMYNEILSKYSSNRAIGAQALIHMAESFEKLGDSESRKIYERVVREFSEQKEALAIARARLGWPTSSGIVTRQAWTGRKVDTEGTVTADGRYLSFVDWETGDLALHDMSNGSDQRLTNKGSWDDSGDFAEESAISPDGKHVAYAWYNGKKGRYDLRLVSSSGGAASPTVLYGNDEVASIAPYDWTPDSKRIAVQIQRIDRTAQIGLVDAANGSLQILKSTDWRGSTRLSVSPDGRYLAFDLPVSVESQQRDVFVLGIDGSREIPAVDHDGMDTVVGWSPDGKQLFFASDRNRTTLPDLWAVPMRDGRTEGSPLRVNSLSGWPFALGITRAGSLYFGVRTDGSSEIFIASVDFDAAKVLSPPVSVVEQTFGSNRQPDWSPDGREIVYISRGVKDPRGRFNTLNIRSISTGEGRELHPMLDYAQWPRWSPDGKSILVHGTDFKGRQGIYRIDVRTGEAEAITIASAGEERAYPLWSPDGKAIFYMRFTTDDMTIVERDLASGKERDLLSRREFKATSVSVSPDGRDLACLSRDPSTDRWSLTIVPLGGQPRELLPLSSGEQMFTAWMPDGRSVIFGASAGTVLMVPVGGRQTQQFIFNRNVRGLRVQPGGNKVLFFTPGGGDNSQEVWVMENFLAVANLKQ